MNDPIEENVETALPPEERAFRASDEHEFAGRKLEPFSFNRQTAAIELGLRYWKLQPEELITIKPAEGDQPAVQMYAGLVLDTAIVLWLCSQPDSTVRKARRKPREFEAQIDQWADENGICIGGDGLAEATGIFVQIVADVNASRGDPVFKEGQQKSVADTPKI